MKTRTIIEWEIGDCVEVANDNNAPFFKKGAKGIIVEDVDDDGDVRIRQTSPDAYNPIQAFYLHATDLKPWSPGYNYLPNGERVPEPEGFELVPEGEPVGENVIYYHADHKWIDAEAPPSVSAFCNDFVRAFARRKQPALQVREGAYYRRRDGKVVGPAMPFDVDVYCWFIKDGTGRATYTDNGLEKRGATTPLDLIAEVPAPEPKMVPFGGPEDLPEWPVIWAEGKGGAPCIVTRIAKLGVYINGESLTWAELFHRKISPDRRNWQTAGKQI